MSVVRTYLVSVLAGKIPNNELVQTWVQWQSLECGVWLTPLLVYSENSIIASMNEL